VDWLSKPRAWVVIAVCGVGLFLLYQLWIWEVERVEVKADTFLVKINLWGKDLPEGEIVAPDSSYKGIQRELLSEGRHFLNPILYTYESHAIVNVPSGQCAVLTRKSGVEIDDERRAAGDYFAGAGERGIVHDVLLPGKHRLNPYEYDYKLENAVSIESNQVGVKVLKYGKDPAMLKDRVSVYVVPKGYRGVQEQAVSPGTYYLNPYLEVIVPVDIKNRPVELRDINFPSRDGFLIEPHVLVSYKVNPDLAPSLFVMLCDDGKLPQADTTPEEQKKNPILQKFVLPLIRGYVRVEGSKYDARDYVSQLKTAGDDRPAGFNPREQLQKELMERVAPQCKKVGVVIESITVTQPDMNEPLAKLAEQISERERTRLVRETNKQLVEQHKAEQDKAAQDVLVKQKSEMVDAKKFLGVATKLAEQTKEVEEAKLKNDLENAKIELDAAKEQAKATLTRGKADADIILAGDCWYDAGLARRVLPWLRQARDRGIDILVGAPGRRYLPRDELVQLASYDVRTTTELDDLDWKQGHVFALRPAAGIT